MAGRKKSLLVKLCRVRTRRGLRPVSLPVERYWTRPQPSCGHSFLGGSEHQRPRCSMSIPLGGVHLVMLCVEQRRGVSADGSIMKYFYE
jgi:hypothetical protein